MSPVASTLAKLLQTVEDQLLHPDEDDFVGRQYVRDEIGSFLQVKNRMLVLVGPPGIGKTALAAQLVREQLDAETPYLAHFCELSGENNPYRFCDVLAQQLQEQLGDGYTLPQTVRQQQVTINASASIAQASGETNVNVLTLNIGGMHPREAFRQVVREPLRAYNEQHGAERAGKPLVIVIDGLHRAWDWDGGQDSNIVSVLADAQDLPKWVNLICTARPGPAVQTLRAQAGVRVVDLQGAPDASGCTPNLADISAYLRERFYCKLPDDARAHFDQLLSGAGLAAPPSGGPVDAFVAQAVKASQGSFLFVRRYADALRAALLPGDAQPDADPAALLRFDAGTLAAVLDSSYASTLAQLRPALDADAGDADEDVLAALAIAYAPLNLPLLQCLTHQPAEAILQSLNQRLKSVIVQQGDDDARTFALYHRGFGEYVRGQLDRQGRGWDVRAAQALEQSPDDDPQLRDYNARYRWWHLLRGLDLAAQPASDAPAAQAAAPATPDSQIDNIETIQREVRDTVIQAQLLRGLAARALDPTRSNVRGSWTAALNALKTAEQSLRHSRALAFTRRRGWRADSGGPVCDELIELERTLIALGDAYSTIGRRMDAGGQRPPRPTGVILWLHMIWDTSVRLPLTLYLLLVLLLQGVSEIHIPGALQNLGRGQDWTVARLYVLSVSAYRRARSLARARGDDDSADEVAQRLAGLYMLMGAYDAAAATYEALLARPTAITRVWRQAIWRLALGEVLVAQEKPDQAIEVLNSALPVFVEQMAPVQQARARSALAAAHYLHAKAADARGDGRLAATLDDLAFQHCQAALTDWSNVTTLQGDESMSVDSALAISNIAHQLWKAENEPRMGDDQRHSLRGLLDTIPERHYPQRFEHPVLRLFRVVATLLLPAYLLAGLLLAVQLPNDVQVQTQTELTFPPPLLDLSRFPNDLTTGKTASLTTNDLLAGRSLTSSDSGTFNVINLTRLADSKIKLQPNTPPLDPLGATRVAMLIMGLYLLLYTVFGLAVIIFSSPAQFQSRRPGRLILARDSLSWRGPIGQGSLIDAIVWVRQDVKSALSQLAQRAAGLLGRAARVRIDSAPSSLALPVASIGNVIAVDRRAFGYLMHDFSFTLVQPRDQERRALIIPGTITNYAELCDELELRMHRPRTHFSVELIRSTWGMCFVVTLFYALALLGLLLLAPAPLHQPLAFGYSLINLYIVATPGLLLPLIWWFVAQPLGANSATSGAAGPLVLTSLLSAGLTAGVLANQVSLAALGLRPDLATPVLAGGLLLALAYYAPPRPLRLIWSRSPWPLARALLAAGALVGLALLGLQIANTLHWYNALVRGNYQIEQVLAPGGCASHAADCPPLQEAIDDYTQVICLRPNDSDGYAFRGFAYLVRQNYLASRADFERALGERPPSDACAGDTRPRPSASQRVSLHANIGAVNVLIARVLPADSADANYQSALQSYAQALGLPASAQTTCADLALAQLAKPAPGADLTGLRLIPPDPLKIPSDRMAIALQLADACYSRGSALAATLTQPTRQQHGRDLEATRQGAWRDLAAAILEYHSITTSSSEAKDRELAQRGLAAAWLSISQIDRPPVGQPDHDTALLQAMSAYQSLASDNPNDAAAFTGQAWSGIQLGAWSSAKAPLSAAQQLRPDSPTYPALRGLIAWLDSTQYPTPKKGAPSIGYTAAISQALDLYSGVIGMPGADQPRAYATRSLLYFSLRNSPHPDSGAPALAQYRDQDYSTWMSRAIADATQAMLAAERDGVPAPQRVGYRYWRARLSFTLALTLQEKSRGLHDWTELAALYSNAYADFTGAAADDLNPDRSKLFKNFWIPWCYALLGNANHLQIAQEAVRRGDYESARRELSLADPSPATFQKWDRLSAPLPDYHYLHGLVSLGLGLPADFANPLVERAAGAAPGADALASYDAAIQFTEDKRYVPQPSADYPDDSRPPIYRAALADLDRLLASPPDGWPPAARAAAQQARAKLQQRLDAITP
jgi:hypothetical protein